MTATENAGESVRKRFGQRKPHLAEMAGVFAIAASGLLASILAILDERAMSTGVPGMILLAFGIVMTVRVAVIGGFGLIGVTVVIAMSSLDPELALLVAAPAAIVLVALVPAVDLAFTSRRETVVHPTLVPGMVQVHLIAALAGAAWALTVVALLVLVDWPSAGVTAAMAALAVAAFAAAATAARASAATRRTPTPQ